jgi:hypothetical protein
MEEYLMAVNPALWTIVNRGITFPSGLYAPGGLYGPSANPCVANPPTKKATKKYKPSTSKTRMAKYLNFV